MLHTRLVFWWSWTTLRKNMDEFGKGFGVWLRQVPVRLSNRHGITNITDICFVLFRSIGWIRLCKTAVSPIVKRSSLLPKENCDCNNYNSCWEMNWSTKCHYLSSSFCSQGLACKTSCLPLVCCFIIHHYIVMFNWWMSDISQRPVHFKLINRHFVLSGAQSFRMILARPLRARKVREKCVGVFCVCHFLVKAMVIVVFIFSTPWNQFWRSMSGTISTD